MKAGKDKVVSFHYTLTVDGAEAETSRAQEAPLQALLGRGQLIPGMERAIEGREAGETFAVDIAPEDGYGERREDLTQRLSKKYFHQAARLKPGMTTVLSLKEGGQRAVTVKKVGMSTIDVDLNHPMAGKALHFDIEIVEVREASEEELAHGHAHGPGGHEH
ncbi:MULTISPECIES: peptidylprolyl isomerase [Oleiagrimonas]|jgi:FKBP-type peptidyl-prolyl cis-trans isomerase SlyD|uniref:Peptidyl-prolyl cis-trans isomerase n=1 Tax=Oleiagrimonas citrea TaxID=1665687 RepID=A0A846ZM51_9GAMM|nr:MULTISPECIES: peptidylprolyl isomerase [Oleiagrimonas]NKZ39046.1 peptidylprolyl isomerase [Oleiagrimonas citrea]RAP57658.1 peptidylprolyl isomerase [Oleiagrimonas sp. MCCC 1A03011]